MRGSSRVGAVLLALALVAVLGSGTAAAKPHKSGPAGLKVRVLGKSQGAILRKGLAVKVTSKRARRVSVRAFSTTFDDGTKALTKTKTIRFARAGHRTVRLALLKSGRKSLASCTQRTLQVRAGKATGRVEMTRTGSCKLGSVDMSKAESCDFIAEPGNALCMLPFPDDYYTVEDPSSETGRRVNFQTEGMPVNAYGQHIEATPYNASNGFSPGETILVKIPGIETVEDVAAMGATPINKLSAYSEKNAPVVVIDTATGKRWPIWVEIDSTAKEASKRVLEIHPAVNFESGGHYIVALRNVKNAAGKKIEAPQAFRYYRDEMPSKQSRINARRQHFKGIFKTLKKAGVRRESLYLAWDFTVASDMNNARRMLAIRNEAFAQLGDTNLADGVVQGKSPAFQVTKVEENPVPGEIARRVKGTVTVPCYLFPSCEPGGTFHLGAGEVPSRTAPGKPTSTASSRSRRPPARPSLPVPRSTGTASSAAPRRSARARSGRWRRGTTSSSAPPRRSGCPKKTRGRRSASSTTSPASRSSPTVSSRGCSTSSTWGGR